MSITTICLAQNQANSLEIALKKIPKDTTYIRKSEKYIWYLVNKLDNIPKADSLLSVTEKIAIQIKDYSGLVKIYFYRGLILYRQGRNDESLKFYQKSLDIVEKKQLPPNYRQIILGAMATYYITKFDSEKALKYALEAIELTQKYHLKEYISPAYLIAAQVYKQIDAAKAEAYYKQSFQKIYEDTDSTQRYLGENTYASYYFEKKQFNEAFVHAKKSLFWVEKYGRQANYSMAWTLLADVCIELKRFKEAYNYIKKSVKLAEELNDYSRMADSYMLLAYYFYFHEKNYPKAIQYYQKGLELCQKIGNTYGSFAGYSSLATIYSEKQDFKKAFKYQEIANILKDSLFSKDWVLKLNKLEIKQNETKVKLLETENKNTVLQRNFLILIGVLILILSLGAIYFIVSRSKYKRFEEQQKMRNKLAADLHDEIGSTLSSISILSEVVAYQQKKGEYKPEIMQQVSHDARNVIDKMDDIIWAINPANDNLYDLETRLKTFAIPLFESKDIEFKFDFSSEIKNIKIDMSKRRDIYLILKEAINNLVKYSNAKNAEIIAKNANNLLVFEVIDNGFGFDRDVNSLRNGLRNMEMRAEKIGATFYINSIIGKGTKVILDIPL